jgi:leucyl/phenylalanyl-tRNA---protein transferase
MPAPSTPQTIPDVTEDIETGSGSGLGRSRDNGIFDQMRANDAVYFCFGSIADTDYRVEPKLLHLFPRHSLFGPLPVSYLTMVRLNPHDFRFPPVDRASPEGLLAVGGDLRPERLLEAYRHGIFPWYNDDQPILWWSPDPRAVLFPNKLHVPRSLKRSLRPNVFTVTLDTSFRHVMEQCAGPRPQYPEGGTWITGDMLDAYTRLHDLGYAHSVETWQDGRLVGGLYGVAIGGAFFAESMFTRVDDASKVALVRLVRQLQAWDFRLIDCQQSSPHVRRFGAEEIPRSEFMAHLTAAVALPDRRGWWEFNRED